MQIARVSYLALCTAKICTGNMMEPRDLLVLIKWQCSNNIRSTLHVIHYINSTVETPETGPIQPRGAPGNLDLQAHGGRRSPTYHTHTMQLLVLH